MDSVEIAFRLNGSPVRCAVPPTLALLELLRDRFGLTGTKLGCGEGECGACTVLVDGEARDACITLAVDVDGREVTTVEGLPAAVQRAFVANGAVQCGFCSPGMEAAVAGWVAREKALGRADLARAIEGNLCRCTGYVKILDAAEAFARESSS
ncbi:MAG: (2Fe-2S)-binding protein [Deltaproteobacteria bacterium]|nr:(2Fe-2S)-binding protein [Deltaproteobacteria bacterium]